MIATAGTMKPPSYGNKSSKKNKFLESWYRQRPNGNWYLAYVPRKVKKHFFLRGDSIKAILYLVLVASTLFYSSKLYFEEISKTRDTIIQVINMKELTMTHPILKQKNIRKVWGIAWLPDLRKLLHAIEKIPRNFDSFPDNLESGSYMDYIEKKNKKFNADEAMEWRSRIIRKPARKQLGS